jgi:hypothetical protein
MQVKFVPFPVATEGPNPFLAPLMYQVKMFVLPFWTKAMWTQPLALSPNVRGAPVVILWPRGPRMRSSPAPAEPFWKQRNAPDAPVQLASPKRYSKFAARAGRYQNWMVYPLSAFVHPPFVFGSRTIPVER